MKQEIEDILNEVSIPLHRKNRKANNKPTNKKSPPTTLNLPKLTNKKKSTAAKISVVVESIAVLIGIIFGVIIGFLSGFLISILPFQLIEWMIGAVSDWSFSDRVDDEVINTVGSVIIIVPLIITIFMRFTDPIFAKRQNGTFIDTAKHWSVYITAGMCGGTIGGNVCGDLVGIIGNEAVSAGIAAFIGAAVGSHLACRWYVRSRLEEEK